MPYFNEAEVIVETLEQLRAQTLAPAAVLMVNSSSTDNSLSIVDSWISKNQNTPGGTKAAGVDIATTDLVAFMDCGLKFPADWLASQLAMLTGDSLAVWVSGGLVASGEGITDQSAIAHTYGYRRFRPCVPSSLLNRNVFEVVGRFKNLRAGYDAQWVRDASRLGQKRLINRNVIVSYIWVTQLWATLWHG